MNIDIVLQRLGATIGAQQVEIELLRQENAELKEQVKEKQDGNNAT
jgi:cell division protein FtsB